MLETSQAYGGATEVITPLFSPQLSSYNDNNGSNWGDYRFNKPNRWFPTRVMTRIMTGVMGGMA